MLWHGSGCLEENRACFRKLNFKLSPRLHTGMSSTYGSVNLRWRYWQTEVPIITTTVAELMRPWLTCHLPISPGLKGTLCDHGKIFKASRERKLKAAVMRMDGRGQRRACPPISGGGLHDHNGKLITKGASTREMALVKLSTHADKLYKITPDWKVADLCGDLPSVSFVCLSLYVVIQVSVVVTRSSKFTACSRLSAFFAWMCVTSLKPELAITQTKSHYK